jgi:hypothetical protein
MAYVFNIFNMDLNNMLAWNRLTGRVIGLNTGLGRQGLYLIHFCAPGMEHKQHFKEGAQLVLNNRH